MFFYEFSEISKNTLFTARSAIDSMTENEESTIAYDHYVMMLLCNTKLEHVYIWTYNLGEILKTTANKK